MSTVGDFGSAMAIGGCIVGIVVGMATMTAGLLLLWRVGNAAAALPEPVALPPMEQVQPEEVEAEARYAARTEALLLEVIASSGLRDWEVDAAEDV